MSRGRRNVEVGLCGGGLGGLMAAIALARGGAQVTVLEAAAELGEIGAGIQMTPNVARFLLRWGISDIIGPNLVQCDRINMRAADGQLIAFSDFKRILRDYGFPWWVVNRHHLLSGLAESCRRHGVKLVLDARVQEIVYTDGHDTKVSVTTERGHRYDFDLLVGSDGVKSVVRKKLFPEVKPTALTMNAAYRAVIPYEEVFAKVPEARSVLGNAIDVWTAPGSYFISYPMTAGKDWNAVLSHHTRDNHIVEDVEDADMDELRESFESYDPIVKKIIALIPESKRWPLLMTGPLERWSNKAKNVVLMGDAAHSMVNHMAQGAATSMEDGVFLGKVIADVVRGILSLPEAVEIYEKTRMPRAWTKQQASFTSGK
jgi:salicylate hydroxylase